MSMALKVAIVCVVYALVSVAVDRLAGVNIQGWRSWAHDMPVYTFGYLMSYILRGTR